MKFSGHPSAFVLASVVTVASFLGATAYTQVRLSEVDELSSTIAANAVPSIEYLGRSVDRLQRIRILLDGAVGDGAAGASNLDTARAELLVLEADVESYLKLTPLPGERELWVTMRRDLESSIESARATVQAIERGDRAAARMLLQTAVAPVFDRAHRTMRQTIEFDVRESARLAREVRTLRQAATRNIIILDALATVLAAFTAIAALRVGREHDRLMESHNALLTDRVAELDRFAGRVAHDILSPLDAVGMGLALVGRSAGARDLVHIERAQRALQRVRQLVEGLLRFARTSAQVDTDARCRVDVVLQNVAADCAEAVKASNIELVVAPLQPREVQCSVGVLTSMVQNLVWNAIKYMGAASTRQIALRMTVADSRVRIDVQDTGPGIPPELQQRLFQPFVRGHHEAVSGIGLGLATVKRLAEAHGGSVAVESRAGVGTTFRIDLPVVQEPVGSKAAPASAHT